MNDDWRLQIDTADPGQALLLVEGLDGPGPGHTLGTAFHDLVKGAVDQGIVPGDVHWVGTAPGAAAGGPGVRASRKARRTGVTGCPQDRQ